MSVKRSINNLTIDEIFAPDGILATRLDRFEYRPSQRVMARAVLEAIRQRRHLCVEAGTGTGKTLAYLIPALFSQKRVIVSTATKNLQDQLFLKDIPFLRRHLLPQLSVTYMKGRQNYLCWKRLEEHNPLLPLGGFRKDLKRISRWAGKSETGDRAELDWIGDSDPLWQALDARREICVGQKCAHFERCFVTRMRQKAFESDLILVNHALLFANLALQTDEIGKILPDFAVLILDEAHEIEEVAANYFGKRLSNYQLEELYRDFSSAFPKSLRQPLSSLQRTSAALFEALPGGEGRHSLNFFRTSAGALIDLRLELLEGYGALSRSLKLLYSELHLSRRRPAEWEPLIRRLENLSSSLDQVFALEDFEHVYWFEKRGRGLFLHATPIDIASIIREQLFQKTEVAILTSATLSTDGSFSYIKERVGLDKPEELIVPGEFDYSRQSILYIPRSFPGPRSPHYFRSALGEIEAILEITQGHAFLLFTSFYQMNRFHEALSTSMRFPLLKQGERPRNRLLELFKATPHAVLCATSSFWQGVDVQGEALRAVIIDKLPFQVPTEPLIAARIHHLESQGENAFLKYSVPNAIITLKQGLGRLIRSRRDCGI
ncbi:MAG: ATP-dependent DNA helicase, partial [Acidobacteriota bacterium]